MSTTTTGFATEFITFSRDSLATVTDSDGLIKWAPHNLLTNSEQFDASSWIKQNLAAVPVLANAEVAPNGTTTADKIVENTGTSSHSIAAPSFSPISGATYTWSVYCKPAGRSFVRLQIELGGLNSRAICDLTTATFGTPTHSAGTATFSATPLSDEWVLISVTATMLSGAAGYMYVYPCSDATTFVYTGDGTSGLYLWGAHLYRSDLGGMQANASAYPYYNPTTPKNLLGWSEAFNSAFWAKASGVSVVADADAAPNGLPTADQVTFASGGASEFLRQNIGMVVNTTYTFSVYARLVSGSATFTVDYGNIGVSSTLTPTSVWQRFSYTFTFTGSNSWIDIQASAGCTIAFWGAQLSDSASLDPYSPVFGAAPSAAAYHGPRLDYDPVTLAAKGLLVEETRTNLLQRSQELGTTWSPTRATVSSDVTATTAPDGSNTADKLVEDNTASASHFLTSSSVSFVDTRVYTFSIYAKSAERTQFGFNMSATVAGISPAIFDLSSETVVSAGSFTNPTITPVGNSWYRCTGTITATGTDSAGVIVRLVSGGSTIYDGDNTSGIYLWGAQLEEGSFATSYIPTAASTVTRNADVASVGTSQFPYNATEGTLVVSASTVNNQNISAYFAHLASAAAGTGYGSSHAIFKGGSSGIAAGQKVKGITYDDANNATGEVVTSGDINTAVIKVAYAFGANDFRASVNGDSVISDTGGAMPSAATVLMLGAMRLGAAGYYLSGHIRQLTYIPRKLSNAELIARSA